MGYYITKCNIFGPSGPSERDAERLKNRKIKPEERKKADAVNADLADLRKNYASIKIFSNGLDLLGATLFDVKRLPHDMRYPAPVITLYEAEK